jgi:uncharacterized membrane protein
MPDKPPVSPPAVGPEGAGPAAALLRWTLRALTLPALAVAGYLSLIALRGGAEGMLGCGGLPQLDCEQVLRSPWSRWLGLPVSLPAVAVYGTMFLAAWLLGPRWPDRLRRAAWGAMVLGATLAGGAALWFVGLMVFPTRTLCLWCLVVHACGALAALLVFVRVFLVSGLHGRDGRPEGLAALAGTHWPAADRASRPVVVSPPAAFGLAALGLAGVAALIAGQMFSSPVGLEFIALTPGGAATDGGASDGKTALQPATPPGADGRDLPIIAGAATVNTRDFPVLGNPEAQWVLVTLSDHTCGHCRALDGLLEQARERYGPGQLAVMFLPVPMNTRCNRFVATTHPDHRQACEYAQLALAVWLADPTKYEAFHRWLYEPERPPAYLEAILRASELVGQKALEKALGDSAVDQRIRRATEIYDAADRGPLPILLVGRFIVPSRGAAAEDLFGFLETRLDLKPLKP